MSNILLRLYFPLPVDSSPLRLGLWTPVSYIYIYIANFHDIPAYTFKSGVLTQRFRWELISVILLNPTHPANKVSVLALL